MYSYRETERNYIQKEYDFVSSPFDFCCCCYFVLFHYRLSMRKRMCLVFTVSTPSSSLFFCVSTLSVYQLTLTNRVLEIIYSREILISTKFREKIIIESQYKHTRFGTVVLVGWVASLNSASPAHAGTKFNCDSIRLHSKFTQIFTPQKLCINKQKNYNKWKLINNTMDAFQLLDLSIYVIGFQFSLVVLLWNCNFWCKDENQNKII